MSYDNGVRESISRTAAGYKNGLMTRFHQHQLAASYQLAAFQHALAIARCCLCRVLDAQTHRSAWINALVAAAMVCMPAASPVWQWCAQQVPGAWQRTSPICMQAPVPDGPSLPRAAGRSTGRWCCRACGATATRTRTRRCCKIAPPSAPTWSCPSSAPPCPVACSLCALHLRCPVRWQTVFQWI